MDKQVIYISEDVIENVVKPVSLFLNDVKAGSVFTHVALPKGNEYKIETKDGRDIHPIFKFSSSNGGTYKFNTFDLRNFEKDTVPFSEYFIPQPGKKPQLQGTFTVNSCEPLLINGDKVYPYFCYVGFEAYNLARKELPEGTRTPDDMRKALIDSGIKDSSKELYYRKVNIDAPIFFYS